MLVVSVFWSQIRGDRIIIFMMSLSSTWAMCLSRRFRYRSCLCSASSGHLRSSATWCGYSRIWKRCARTPRKRFRQTKPSSCVYCGTWIKCDMYRHVAKFHLDLAQLWRCPVSWCTVSKGTPQDCIDHVRGVHDVPWVVKSASIEQFVPPWTVRRQV